VSSFDVPANPNDPASVPPGTVGPPAADPGDPHGVQVLGEVGQAWMPPPIMPMPWSGWPAEWMTPNWFGQVSLLTDTAWACLDSNASILSTMPPYLVGAADSLGADWLNNPDPDLYVSWEEFAKQVFWDFQAAGEVFVLVTARYSSGWPARFHVVPPWMVIAELGAGARRFYSIGGVDITDDVLHIRYTSRVGDAHGRGPLEVAGPRMVAAVALARYASELARTGGVPHSVLVHPNRLTAEQAAALQQQWVTARMSSIGMPAVLAGGVDFKTLSFDPAKMALVELSQWNEARIAVLLGVPPVCMALPSGGDPMTYSNTESLFMYRWRAGLKPLAASVMAALSGWALPRGTTVELNRDEFIAPSPLERAKTAEIWHNIGAQSAAQIAETERFGDVAAPSESLSSGVMQ
jgi:HK97 family phage portal protein